MVLPARQGKKGTDLKVLMVHEDKTIFDTCKICINIRWPGSDVIWVSRGLKVFERIQSEGPDIVLLQLELPDVDGLEMLREIRQTSEVPIVVLSSNNNAEMAVLCLESGADRFIGGSFSNILFLAVVRATLRRTNSEARVGEGIVRLDGFTIDLVGRQLLKDGKDIPLSSLQWSFLSCLARSAGKVITHAAIAKKVWGTEQVESSSIKMCVHQLRKKLGDNPRKPRFLRSHRGMGYSLVAL